MIKFKSENHNSDVLRGVSGRGLTNSLASPQNSVATQQPRHPAHKFTSDYFEFSNNYTGRWGKYIDSYGNGPAVSFRQIDRDDYMAILKKYPGRGVATPSNFAINIPGVKRNSASGLVMPNVPPDPQLIEELFDNSKEYKMTNPSVFVKNMYLDAVKKGVEKSAYIVLDHKGLKLEILEATGSEIVTASGSEVSTKLIIQKKNNLDTRVRTLPLNRTDYDTKQVIGTIHTHYHKTTSEVMPDGTTKVTKMGYGPSDADKQDAVKHFYVNYIIDDKFIHRTDYFGRVKKNLPRDFDILTDCLQIFSGMY